MPTYKVQAPDGKTITLEGPAGASQADVIAQAQKLYQPKAAAPLPPSQREAKGAIDAGSDDLERQISGLPEAAKRIARDKYFADPRVAALRVQSATKARPTLRPVGSAPIKIADAVQADNLRRRMQQSAQNRADTGAGRVGNFLTALKAGLTRGAFGLPERLAAAGEAYLPASITGNESDASYDQILDQIRTNTDAELDKSLGGNILGQIMSGGLIGGAAAKSIGALAAGTPVAEAALTAANVAPKTTKIVAAATGGAAGGAAQAAGEGSDVGTGAEIGAAAGPVALGLGKVAGYLLRPLGDLLRLSKPGDILRRFTTASEEDMRAAADEFRQRTGAEPTLYEIMPLADRNRVAKDIVGSSPQNSERAAAAVRERVGNVGPEMQDTVQTATGGARARVMQQMVRDMEAARGGVPDISDPDLAERAAGSAIDMKDFQAGEARATMQPVENTVVADTLQDTFPRSLQQNPDTGEIDEIFSDPEVNAALTNAASVLRLRLSPDNMGASITGLTADDASRILRQLGKVDPASPQAGAAQRAGDVLLDHIQAQAPEAAAAIEQMRNAWAARARMVEGMAEGARTRTRESIPVGTSAQARVVRNAFDSPEGEAGRLLGQTNVLGRDLAGSPNDVLRVTGDIAQSGQTQRALAANLGPDAADTITGAAEAQARSVRNLAAVGKESGRDADALDLEDIGRMVLALNPASMPTTKLFALSRLKAMTHLPDSRARTIIDMMFSQDPTVTNRAIGLLNGAGQMGREFLRDIRNSIVVGQLGGEAANAATEMPAGITNDMPMPAAAAAEMPANDQVPGMVEPGNIDLNNRPVVHNADGTISTVRSITVGFDDGFYLIPTVVNGEVVSDEEAIDHYKQTGEHLGKFSDEASANAYAQQLHEDQAAQYGDEETPHGRAIIEEIFPEAFVTSDHRGPENDLYDPNSGHAGYNTVDVRPIPGMTFDEFLQKIEDEGHTIVHAYDETRGPADPRKARAWGPHWHVEIG